jgi:hypothetical protein
MREIDMTARIPLHTEPIEPGLFAAPNPQEPLVAAPVPRIDIGSDGSAATGLARPNTSPAQVGQNGHANGATGQNGAHGPSGPDWVDMAAGQAVREATVTPPPTAHRPVELDDLALKRAELAAEERALAFAGEPGPVYRSVYRIVQTVVLGFFASGAGMAAYVLIRG